MSQFRWLVERQASTLTNSTRKTRKLIDRYETAFRRTIQAFERVRTLNKLNMPEEIVMRHDSCFFKRCYAAGYYSYYVDQSDAGFY
jgi:Zn-dependent oligopeptidase